MCNKSRTHWGVGRREAANPEGGPSDLPLLAARVDDGRREAMGNGPGPILEALEL